MKHIFFKINSKALVAATFLTAAVLLAGINGSNAATVPGIIEILSADTTAKVAFLGNSGNALVFNVAVKNDKGDKFILTIKTEAGDILFRAEYSDVNFDKNFKVLKSENNSYYFNISSVNRDIEQTFAVKASTKEIEDIVVTKL